MIFFVFVFAYLGLKLVFYLMASIVSCVMVAAFQN